MEQIKTRKGLLTFSRNLGILATSSFVLISAGITNGILTSQEPAIRYFAGTLMLGNALISGTITYDINKELKKLK